MSRPLSLLFEGAFGFGAVRRALAQVVQAPSGAGGCAIGAAEWTPVSLETLEDRNGVPSRAFRAEWRLGAATLRESCVSSDGNPHDGWGYDLEVRLGTEGLLLTSKASAWTPEFAPFPVSLSAEPATCRTVRRVLAASLGGDRSDAPHLAAANLQALEGVDPGLQQEILAGALACGRPEDYGWADVLRWKDRLRGGALEQRLRETPAELQAWEEAARCPPAGWDSQRIACIRARLAPWDPVLAEGLPAGGDAPWREHPLLSGRAAAHPPGWSQLEDGHGPGRARPALATQLAERLFGRGLPSQSPALTTAPRSDRTLAGTALVRAQWTEGPYPLVLAEWDATRRSEKPGACGAIWAWLWGAGPGDVAVLLREIEDDLELGIGLYVGGSAEFRSAAMTALETLEPFAWRPVERLFAERTRRVFADTAGDPRQVASRLLRELGLEVPAVQEALESCHCGAGWGCEHAKALTEIQRDWERRRREAEARRQQMHARARVEALRAVAGALGLAGGFDGHVEEARRAQAMACAAIA